MVDSLNRNIKAVCRPLTVAQAAYLAGIIDGEGYIGITRSKTSVSAKGCKRGVSYRLLVCVKMVNPSALYFAQDVTGLGRVKNGTPRQNPKHRNVFTWEVWSRQAASMLKQLKPYLLVKAEQADCAIRFQSIMRMGGFLSEGEWDARERMWTECIAYNGAGKGKLAARRLPEGVWSVA